MVAPQTSSKEPILSVKDVTIRYGDHVALKNVSFDIQENEIFGVIGPANSGKTSFLRALNRMDQMTTGMKIEGDIIFAGKNIKYRSSNTEGKQWSTDRSPDIIHSILSENLLLFCPTYIECSKE